MDKPEAGETATEIAWLWAEVSPLRRRPQENQDIQIRQAATQIPSLGVGLGDAGHGRMPLEAGCVCASFLGRN